MRRSICFSEPSSARAGEVNNWKFIYTTAAALPKGTRLKFDLVSKGRDIDWETPSASPKATDNAIYGLMPDNKVINPRVVDSPESITPQFEFTLPGNIAVGANFTIVMGQPKGTGKGKKKDGGTRAQCTAQRRRPFLLYVDPTGKGVYDEPEVFNVDVRGGDVHLIRVLTPSFVAKNRRFDVVVRFEDEFGNLSNSAPEDTLIELGYENLRENLSWKLFVPETGFIALPNLYFNETGVYTICLLNTKTGVVFRSPPIKCFAENNINLFWGLLHGESERFDSTENIESCLRHIRDDRALNFYGTSPFENAEETSAETWKLITTNMAEFDEEDRFITFLGMQWVGARGDEGVRQIVFAKDNRPVIRKKDAKYGSLKKIYKSFSPKEFISIPSFTMGKGYEFDFSSFNPEFERVVEIYNAWGSSECTAKEGNPRPIKGGKGGVQESAEGAIQKALKANCRFGFVAGGLDDRGLYSGFFEGDQEQYSPGFTGIIAKEHTRAALFEALYNRSCYATTGQRIIITFSLSGAPMGAEINTADKPGCLVNRHIAGTVAGTTKLKLVEIIRNGKVIKTFKADTYWIDYIYDDMDPLNKVAIEVKGSKTPPFAYYYIRVTQADGHMAWGSPIWIDLVPPVAGKGRRPIKAGKKAPVIQLEEVEEVEEEEEDLGFDDDEDDEE